MAQQMTPFRPRPHMTRWLDPWALLRTAARVLRSRRVGTTREDLTPEPVPTASYDDPKSDLWFDYVADLGDAFDPTMAVAWHLGRESLDPPTREDREEQAPDIPARGLPRGRFLVFGGDEVYPYASKRRYEDQLVGPYAHAWEGPPQAAEMFAIPGNHDWYGGLQPWRETFCEGRRIGAWATQQQTSWFALGLPHGWWLWGIDTALDGSINKAQRTYFTAMAQRLGPDDRIILCTPVPLWSLQAKGSKALTVIDGLVDEVVATGASVPVFLSGDHHVFAVSSRKHKARKELHVTSGGGGAFLHPTHNLGVTPPGDADGFDMTCQWPDKERSRGLVGQWWQVVADRQSQLLGLLFALAHLLFGLTSVETRGWVLFAGFGAMFLISEAPKETKRKKRKSSPWSAHKFAILTVIWQVGVFLGSSVLLEEAFDRIHGSPWTGLARLGVAVVGGLASLSVFAIVATHAVAERSIGDNLVFSARHLRGYKHFVRCRIAADTGELTMYAVGILDPGRGWTCVFENPDSSPPDCSDPHYVWGGTSSPTQ